MTREKSLKDYNNPHLIADNERPDRFTFKSDKYAWCPPGFVPLKVTDPMAADLLLRYAGRRAEVDLDFARALASVVVKLFPEFSDKATSGPNWSLEDLVLNLRSPSFNKDDAKEVARVLQHCFSVGVERIAKERLRQRVSEGWSPEHDDDHDSGQMALAAACYALFASLSEDARAAADLPEGLTTSGRKIKGWAAMRDLWPWDRKWWKPKTPIRDLERAGALIAAEIERRLRAGETS